MAMLSVPTLAGFVSTVIFAASTVPMLVKACRSRDLASYSLGNIALANLGNAVYSVYVYSLPPGPIWLLHTFYLVSSALMLGWYLRYGLRQPRSGRVPTAAGFRGAGGHVASPGPKVGSRLRGPSAVQLGARRAGLGARRGVSPVLGFDGVPSSCWHSTSLPLARTRPSAGRHPFAARSREPIPRIACRRVAHPREPRVAQRRIRLRSACSGPL